MDFPLESENKGMEGVAYVRRGSDGYLLGLCEGNKCRGGARGREPGGGRAYFNVEGVTWLTKDKIAVVSDKRKSGEQPKFAAEKDQSVHIFRIPR